MPRSHDQMPFSDWEIFMRMDALMLWKLTGKLGRTSYSNQSQMNNIAIGGRGEEGESVSILAGYITAHILKQFADLANASMRNTG